MIAKVNQPFPNTQTYENFSSAYNTLLILILKANNNLLIIILY